MIDFTKLPEMFFFTPTDNSLLVRKMPHTFGRIYEALLEIDNHHAMQYLDEAIARILRYLLVDEPERLFDYKCHLQTDPATGRQTLDHNGVVNLVVGCILSFSDEDFLRESKLDILYKSFTKHINSNHKALTDSGYGELLDMILNEWETDEEVYTFEHRINIDAIKKAIKDNTLDWRSFTDHIEEEDLNIIISTVPDQECRAMLLFSFFQVLNFDSLEDILKNYAFLLSKLSQINELPLIESNLKLNNKIEDFKQRYEHLEEELSLRNQELLERDTEIARLQGLLRQNGISYEDECDEQLPDVDVPKDLLKYFRDSKIEALRFLKFCQELKGDAAEIAKHYNGLGAKVLHRKDWGKGFIRSLCGWLNLHCPSSEEGKERFNYNTMITNFQKYEKEHNFRSI